MAQQLQHLLAQAAGGTPMAAPAFMKILEARREGLFNQKPSFSTKNSQRGTTWMPKPNCGQSEWRLSLEAAQPWQAKVFGLPSGVSLCRAFGLRRLSTLIRVANPCGLLRQRLGCTQLSVQVCFPSARLLCHLPQDFRVLSQVDTPGKDCE